MRALRWDGARLALALDGPDPRPGVGEAVFTEPLAAAFEILDQMPSLAGTRAVVLGDGKLGVLVAQVMAGAGAEVVLAGRHEAKLARARGLGIRTAPPPLGADLVVDA